MLLQMQNKHADSFGFSILFAEIILYPLLVGDHFELIITDGDGYRGEKVKHYVSFDLFILSSSLILYIRLHCLHSYIHIYILIGTI